MFDAPKYLIDTNVLLDNPDIVNQLENVVVPLVVLKELDKIKNDYGERGFKARRAIRILKEAHHVEKKFHQVTDESPDQQILDLSSVYKYTLVTNDYSMQIIARTMGIRIVEPQILENEYTGWKDLQLTNSEMADFYQNKNINWFNLITNQYLIIRDGTGAHVDAYVWTGYTHERVTKKTFASTILGRFVPKDYYQMCAMDSVTRNQMTMIKGKAGSGKSLLALSYAMQMIEEGKCDKLVCFVNPIGARGAARLGFYPGDRTEKILETAVGSMLSSKFGSKVVVETLLNKDKLILLPFTDIRGFDTTGMNAIVYFLEAQNLDTELMKLAIQRCGSDTRIILDGDYNQQVDSIEYEGYRNGMRRVSEVFRGQDFYGEVELPNVYRSRMAEIADEL